MVNKVKKTMIKKTKLTATKVGAGNGENRNVLSGINVKTAKVHTGESSYEEYILEESAVITIGVFMDGTLNNRDNTNARLAYEKAIIDKTPLSRDAKVYKNVIEKVKKDLRGSYDNDLSNVARMEPAYKLIKKGKQLQTRVYVEGIGTTNKHADDDKGYGEGVGATGILKKVEKACIEASKKISKLVSDNEVKQITILRIDIFGFSRGAAAARNFAHEIKLRKNHKRTIFNEYDKTEKKTKKEQKYTVDYGELGMQLGAKNIDKIKLLTIRFIGLYETVASYGYNHTGGWSLGENNDSVQLHLNAVSRAWNTFQLVAQDEHRENFTLTNINSAGARGVTKFIPGVHSDIGGGYIDNYEERDLIIFTPPSLNYHSKLKLLQAQLIEQGWYKESELTTDKKNNLLVNKTIKSKNYSYIPLHIMVEYAITKKLLFNKGQITKDYALNITSLVTIKKRLDQYINDNAPAMDWNNKEDNKLLRVIRANYIHTSAEYSTRAISGTYPPHKPFDSYLTRRRKNDLNG